jgi:predicted lipid-binding transport protein (Tim44 family)
MNKHFFQAMLLSLSMLFALVGEVDAARLGGGRSFGRAPSAPMQRQATPAQKPVQQTQPVAPAPIQAPAPNRFGGMGGLFGGLAAGLGIGFLLSHFGMGEGASSVVTGLLVALLAGFCILFVIRRLLPAVLGAFQKPPVSGIQRTGITPGAFRQEPAFTPAVNQLSAASIEPDLFKSTLPPGFDEYTFLENAKQYFRSLQKAWDLGDLAALREFTTPEMFATISQDLAGRADAINQTDVISINAKLIGIETKDNLYLCCVEFSGMISEQAGAPANHFSEMWNLSKPVEGPGGWVLAGISQLV